LPAALRWDAELDQDVLEDLLEADGRVEEKDRLRVRRDGVEEPAEEGGLPGPRLPDEGDEPLACVDPVAESRQRLLIVVIQIEEARVGRDVEGQLAESVEVGVHAAGSRSARGMPPPGLTAARRAHGSCCTRARSLHPGG